MGWLVSRPVEPILESRDTLRQPPLSGSVSGVRTDEHERDFRPRAEPARRRLMRRRVVVVALLAALAGFASARAVGPETAAAARSAPPGLQTGFADNLYFAADLGVRNSVFDRTVEVGARIVRINVVWRLVAGAQPANPRDPADPAYRFGAIDDAVRGAAQRGLDVLLTLYSAPDYAQGPGRPAGTPAGTWRPDPGAFADFAAAVATRYSGGFAGLPRVRYFQAWNEPNLNIYLTPQWDGKALAAPAHYVAMLNAFYDAVKAVDRDNRVVTAGTAPYGDPPGGPRTHPLAFWRAALCVRGRAKPRGVACPVKPKLDILAHHPINTSGGPTRSAIHPDDVSTPDFGNVRRVLRAAERHRNIATGRRHPLWATEIWWDSNPPDRFEGVPLKRHARYLAQALHLLWRAGARTVINLQIRDIAYDPQDPFANTNTGLLFDDGTPKPAFAAFRFPFVVDKVRGGMRAWGRAPVGGRLVIERRGRGAWQRLATRRVRSGSVFTAKLDLRGRQRLRARVGGEHSLVWVKR